MYIQGFVFLSGEKTPYGYKAIIEILISDNIRIPVEIDFDEDGHSSYEALNKYEHPDREFLEDLIHYAVFNKYLLPLKSN